VESVVQLESADTLELVELAASVVVTQEWVAVSVDQ
jgi:hypothetical protein